MKIKELNNNEMSQVSGGSIGSSILNAVNNIVTGIYELGRQLGSGVRRLITGEYCRVN